MNRFLLVAARQGISSSWIARTALLSSTGGLLARTGAQILAVRAASTATEDPMLHHHEESDLALTRFGRLQDVKALQWPADFRMKLKSCKGHLLTYQMVDVDKEADRVAEIFQHALGEIRENSNYDWHHSAPEIRARVKNGNYSIWGTYEDDTGGKLIAVQSAELLPGQRGVRWVWGAEDPEARHHGIWESIGTFMNNMIGMTGAQYGCAAVPTTHSITQRAVEASGWAPDGFLRGALFYGDANGKYYRQNLVHYSKLFNKAEDFVQAPEDMILTDRAARLVKVVADIQKEVEMENKSSEQVD